MNIYKCLVIFLMAIVFNLNVIKIYCRPQLTPPQQQWCHVPSHCLKAFYNAAMDSIAQKRTRFNLDPLQLDLNTSWMRTKIAWGNRFEGGWIYDNRGVLLTYADLGSQSQNFQTNSEFAASSPTQTFTQETASGNGTDGGIKVATDAIQAAQAVHAFMGMTKMGQAAVFETRGNLDCHVILRGGKQPNYSAADVAAACAMLQGAGLREQVMVDVSHANSSKQHRRQIEVAADVAAQVAAGDRRIMGVMIESHLEEGRLDIVPGTPLKPGVSVTDACISMAQTIPVLQALAQAVRTRRAG
jgi:hypothetical protein